MSGEKQAGDSSREHQAIVEAMQSLERALASPAPGREEAWKKRAAAELANVVDELRVHVDSAEGAGGLLAQVETEIGRPREVAQAESDHQHLVEAAQRLVDDLKDVPSLSSEKVRQRAAALTAELRRHQGLEADLILLAFGQDIGVGD